MSINGKCILVLKSFRMPIPPTLSSSLSVMGSFKFRCPSMLCLKASIKTGIFIMLAAGKFSSLLMSILSLVSRILGDYVECSLNVSDDIHDFHF